MNNENFCIAPWVHTYVYPNGMVSPCCQARSEELKNENYNCGSLYKNSLSEIWNSKNYKKLRKDLITFGKSEICEECYKIERSGHNSMRTMFNSKFSHHIDKVKETKVDGTFDKLNIVYWDFRLSNVCNFKCRMCSPLLSSSWESESKKNSNFGDEFFLKDFNFDLTNLNTLDAETFLEENSFLFDVVEEVYFGGGEPLLMDIHYKILKKLLQLKKYHIPISYNTNFSSLNYKNINVLDLWSIFKHLSVYISIDGAANRGELIRNGFNWKKFVQNFYEFKQKIPLSNVQVTPTVQILNSFHICDLQEKLFKLKIINKLDQFYFSFLVIPNYLSVQILPNLIKKQICDRVDKHIKDFLIPNNASKNHLELWESYKTFIFADDCQHLIPKFLKYTEALDKIRNENTKETFPELNELCK